MHISQFASNLKCRHCGSTNSVAEWPLSGDRVPFYYQDEPGKYTLTVNCPSCGKNWYVVWDDNPGPVTPLDL